ncbi:hypothetical protein RF55_15255 [Lasius niger]|uniref:DUF7041 domain-containing protein n=1 Tax=Lasius niger TaxID=67767 RepID=A0A0J7K6V1_LASNI|nr:hypothetical protein RF55_15257 [Lasius niger]KMQ85930.1 hypothetical protein RF55_15255 [Lasius niger]
MSKDSASGSSGRAGNGTASENTTVLPMRVGIRSTPFWKSKPELWFVQMEAQFLTAGITTDETKYNYVVQCLDDDLLSEVSDIVLNPPAGNKYAALKDRLIKSFAVSSEKRLRKLLNEVDLGDRRPSQLLRRMRDLAQTGISEDVLKSLWLQRLPQQVQAILTATKHDLEELSQLADRISDVLPSEVNAITTEPTKTPTADSQLSLLTDRIAQLETRLARSTSRERQRKNRSRSTSRDKSDYCWYHRRFGNKATKCTRLCGWKSTKQEN